MIMTEIQRPTAIRLTVSFASAVYEESHVVEGVRGQRCGSAGRGSGGTDGWRAVVEAGAVAVLADPPAALLKEVSPAVIVDAIMAKRNLGTSRVDGVVVVALGPGFHAGRDADAVIETARGHDLGRIIRDGGARADTGIPGDIAGRTADRVLRAPVDGEVALYRRIGDLVEEGDVILRVGQADVRAPFRGCLRGAIHPQVVVSRGMKVGDVDPRGDTAYVHLVSDKARAVGRAALEAALVIGRERGLFGVRSAR